MHNLALLRSSLSSNGTGKTLANDLNAKIVVCRLTRAEEIADGTRILNFGRSELPKWYSNALSRGCRIFNHPHAVGLSVNKIKTFKALTGAGVPTLEWTTSRDVAKRWRDEGETVVVRKTVTGCKGKGIALVRFPEYLPTAPLYTKFYDKTHEYRVFVVDGKPVFLVEKKMYDQERITRENVMTDQNIRNHDNGWFFSIRNLSCDLGTGRHELERLAVGATRALGLDFAAMDIVAKHDERGRFIDARICETNTAPSLTGTTTKAKVTAALREMLSR